MVKVAIRFTATQVKAKDVKPGQYFSSAGPEYWDNPNPGSVGEKVYIRTDAPCPKGQEDEIVFLITTNIGETDLF